MQEAETVLSDARKLLRIDDTTHEVRFVSLYTLAPALGTGRTARSMQPRTLSTGHDKGSVSRPRNKGP